MFDPNNILLYSLHACGKWYNQCHPFSSHTKKPLNNIFMIYMYIWQETNNASVANITTQFEKKLIGNGWMTLPISCKSPKSGKLDCVIRVWFFVAKPYCQKVKVYSYTRYSLISVLDKTNKKLDSLSLLRIFIYCLAKAN